MLRVDGGMRIILTALALAAATPAAASTLVLYDVDASYGDRLAITPLLEQEFARQTRDGVANPILVPVNDDGSPRTVTIEVAGPAPVLAMAPGMHVQRGRIIWRVTTSRAGNTLSYEIAMSRLSVMTDGVTLASPTNNETDIVGAGATNHGNPIIARRYTTFGGARMVIGFLKP